MKDPLYKQINNWRVWPRLFSIFYAILIFQVGTWFMQLNTPSVEQSGFATVVVTSAAAWFKFYVSSGPSPDPE